MLALFNVKDIVLQILVLTVQLVQGGAHICHGVGIVATATIFLYGGLFPSRDHDW